MSTRDLRQHLAAGGAAAFNLSKRAKFQLHGADRVRFLNGQVSNDIRRLTTDAALPACVMTAKGKMNALVWVSASPDFLQLDVEAELRETLAGRLERYIISDDVTLTDTSDDLTLTHVLGASITLEMFARQQPPVECRRSRRFGLDGFDLIAPQGFKLLAENLVEVDDETAETFRIEQGIPIWGAELNENTIPVEAGLDANAIDYHKGCYIGQEVISRIKSVGHVNRQLCGFVADGPLAAGMTLSTADKEAGVITSAAWSFALDKAVALGYLKRGVEAGSLYANTASQPEIAPIPVEVRTFPIIS